MIEKLKKIHRDSDELDFHSMWNEGIFVFDSNVLLDLYRLPVSAREDLISVLTNDKFNKRIWIGFQVALEFLNNKYEAIGDQKNKFTAVRKLLSKAEGQYSETMNELTVELGKLKLKHRHSLIDPDKFISDEKISEGIGFIRDFLAELQDLEIKQSDVNDTDSIKNVVFDIFEGKVGDGFDKVELEKIYKDGAKRYDVNIPPGYKDKKKEGSYLFDEKEYIRKYGDLLLWKEIIEKSNSESLKYVVLVTGDVKEDWWFEKRGKKLGPRKELLNEIYTKAPSVESFHMYDTSSFLQYAKNELNLEIQDSSISEAKKLIAISRENREIDESGLVDLAEYLKNLVKNRSGLKAGIGKSVKNLPLFRINEMMFYPSMMELLDNVRQHSVDNYVGIQARESETMVVLKFKNKFDKSYVERYMEDRDSKRGFGVESIFDNLSRWGIDVHTSTNDNYYTIELFIPRTIEYFRLS
ncbi:PIN-like domain-containing protein [Vibrio vulnificus]|uniref:PIN-like domain-containing protein n=1 Tax=Vibrio vulnificus TaxID=672 RepID=UPI00405997B5